MSADDRDDSNDPLQSVIAEILDAERHGEVVDRDALLAQHPQLADSLREFFVGHDRIKSAVDFDSPTVPPAKSEQRFCTDDDQTLPPSAACDEDATVTGNTSGTDGESFSVGERVRYFGDYELVEEIARGGMGVVFKARQLNLNRTVALKMILAGQFAGQEDVQRFYTEAEAAANLDHPGIVPIFEIGECDGQHYFSMGYVEGQSLSQRLADDPLTPRQAAELMKKVCDAIAYAHERGVIHRDLKPANILLDASGQPKVTDFGLAKKTEAGSDLTGTGQILGTPAYMPPEQASGDIERVGPLADVYSLGAVLYCLLTGCPPFQAASPMDTLIQVLEKDPVAPRQRNAAIPIDLETICLKCLEKEQTRRYVSAAALAEDLGRYLNDEPIEARPSGAAYKLWRRAKRNRTTSLALVAALVALIGGVIFFLDSRDTANRAIVAQQSAKGAREALQRIQSIQGIQQLAIVPFQNLSGNPDDDWLGGGFASVLQTKLSGNDLLKVIGKGSMDEAAAALGISDDGPMEAAEAIRFGKQLVVDHVITGEFQRVGEQIQVTARLVNIQTGAVDRGGMQVHGAFATVFDLQTELANQCLAQLGVSGPSVSGTPDTPDAIEVNDPPAASVEAWTFLGQGQQALANGDYDQAIRLCTRAIEEDPELWKAYRTLGIAHTKIDEVDESIQAFQHAIDINPDDWTSQTYFNLLSGRMADGFAALAKAQEVGDADLDLLKLSTSIAIEIGATNGVGKFEVDYIQDAIEHYPDDEELRVLLASLHFRNGNTDSATEALEQAVKVNPHRFTAHLRLSIAYEDQGRADEAQQELAEAEKYRPEGIRGFREFGDVYADAGKYQRAIEEFSKAIEQNPDDAASHMELGELYIVSDILKAIGHFETALALRPNSSQILSLLCRLTNLIGQDQKLEQYASQWVQSDPESYEAHQYLRLAYLKSGQSSKAEAELTEVAKLSPRHTAFFVMTGNTLIQTSLRSPGMIDEAIRVLQKGTETFPDDTQISRLLKFSLALKAWHHRQWKSARDLFEGLRGQFEGDDVLSQSLRRDCATFLATCYERLDQMPEAADQIRQSVSLMPQLSPKAFSIYEQAKNYEYSIELAKRLIALQPNDLQLHRDLIKYYALADQWDEAKQFASSLPATTAEECKRRVHTGVALLDWMHRRGKINASAKQHLIEKLLQQTSGMAGDLVPADLLETLAIWAKFPQNVLVIGAFDGSKGLGSAFPPDSEFDPDASYPGYSPTVASRRDVSWHVVGTRVGDRIDFQNLREDDQPIVAYCSTHLVSPIAQRVTLVVNGSDPGKMWLNDHPLALAARPGGGASVDVQLKKGANRLLAKTIDVPMQYPLAVTEDWHLSINAIDSSGLPAKLRWSTDPDVARGDARALVHELESRLLIKEDVIDRIENSKALQGNKRALALDIAKNLPEDADRLSAQSMELSATDGTDQQRFDLAVRVAEAACRADPTDRENYGTLARAYYNAGQYEPAIEAARRAIQLCREQIGTPYPGDLAVLAMSHHQLGHAEEAGSEFVNLTDLMVGWAGFEEGEKALVEAKSLLGDSVPRPTEFDAIKLMVYQAHKDGWVDHRYDDYLSIFSDDVSVTTGRGPEANQYDVTSDRATYEAIIALKYHGPPPGGEHYIAHQTIDGAVDGDRAWLQAEYMYYFPDGFAIDGAKLQLKKINGSWKVDKSREWPIIKRINDRLVRYDEQAWNDFDERVRQARSQNKLRSEVQALRDGYRFVEAMEAIRKVTELPDVEAKDWLIRAEIAFWASAPEEVIPSYRTALKIDPNASVPDYEALVEHAPPEFAIDPFDLPPSKEGSIRSISGGPASQMVFENRTPYTLDVYWINYRGKRTGPYRRIRPGATWDYRGAQRNHPWLVTDSNGRGLGIFVASEASRNIPLSSAQ